MRGYLLGRKKKKELAILGGNTISVNPADPEMIVVGTDSGACYRCKVSAGLNLFGQESGPFDQMPQSLRWKQEAAQVMNLITNKKGMENVLKIVERYCIDQGMKEIEASHIFDSKPNIRYLFSVPFNRSYEEKHFGPVTKVRFNPFISRIFLSCSVDGVIKLYDANTGHLIVQFEPGVNEYLWDVKWSPFRPGVFACVGNKGLIYVYDLAEQTKTPVAYLD